MSARKICNECGAMLAGAAVMRGLCGKCLVRLALEEADGSSETETTRREPVASQSGERIGSYRILQKIGEGGMGVVFRAEQVQPVRRTVALKLIKAGMDTEQVVARFESERQALALMDHPGIARVFDAGATEQGRPYFVMEYVRGEPIATYCDRNRLSTGERLELFIRVCEAVHHAHQKGIIHRDIKPSNVLVTEQDTTPVPKIIDFGVAKATQQRLTERTLFTQLGAMVGTPEYMSPEQAEPSGQDVDTRTDVYSLGVLLYELLVGALPFDPQELRRGAFDEICRRIREEEPSKPSARLSTLGDASEESANRRRTDRRTLVQQLRGDLDWVTMKALSKERNRRYASANEFAEDVRRHLNHLPVAAGPPSAGYRMRKFVRRHRWGVAAGALVLSALALGLVGTTYGLIRATSAERRAVLEATAAQRVSDFLVELFDVSDPGESRGNSITAREVLDTGADRIERELADQPRVKARLLHTIGRVYLNLGLYEPAAELLDGALLVRRAQLGADHRDTLSSVGELAWLNLKRSRYDEAESLYREALASRRRLYGDDHPDTLEAMSGLGNLCRIVGKYEQSQSLLEEALAGQRRVHGEDHRETLATTVKLAALRESQGRYDEARSMYVGALQKFRASLGDDHPSSLAIMGNLAWVYVKLAQYEDAERLHRELTELHRRVLGDEHPDTLNALTDLANFYRIRGRSTEAEPIFLEVLDAQRRTLDPGDRDLAVTLINLGAMYAGAGRYDEAESVIVEGLEIFRENVGEEHQGTLVAMGLLAGLYGSQQRYDEAEALFARTLETQVRVLGEDHSDTLLTLHNMGHLYALQARYDEAEQTLSRAAQMRRTVLGEQHPRTRESVAALEAVRADRAAEN